MKFFLKSVKKDKVKWMKALIKAKLNNQVESCSLQGNRKRLHKRVYNKK